MIDQPVGVVLQVNVSPGGVPKHPVSEVWIRRPGLDGDGHAEPGSHGGPHRAVCLFAIEAIRRVAAEGHPIHPGSCGENLTTEGLEVGLLPVGARLAIGDRLVLELSQPVRPCRTIAGSFVGGHVARIAPDRHPIDARVYARVLVEGPVRPGDPIRVLPPRSGGEAAIHLLLDRIEAAEAFADRARWRAAARLGWPVELVDDGELVVGASGALPEPAFAWADGLRTVPHLIERVVGTFRRAGTAGWLPLPEEGLPDGVPHPASRPVGRLGVFALEPDRVRVPDAIDAHRVVVRPAAPGEGATVAALLGGTRTGSAPFAPVVAQLVGVPGHAPLLALRGPRAVGAALVVVRRRVALVRYLAATDRKREGTEAVATALIRGAAELATQLDGDLLAAVGWLGPGRPAAGLARAGVLPVEPLYRAGLVPIAERRLVRLRRVDRPAMGR